MRCKNKANFKCILLILIFVFSFMIMTGCTGADGSKPSFNGKNDDENTAENAADGKESDDRSNIVEPDNKGGLGGDSEIADNVTDSAADNAAKTEEIIVNPSQHYSNLSTWAAYWDYADITNEIGALGEDLDTIVCFEALYGSDAKTILHPEGCDELLKQLKDSYGDKTIYLSYTNDCQNPDGTYTQKSTDFLSFVLNDSDNIDAYTSAMVKDAKQSGVDGIELDYENMRKVTDTFPGYAEFVKVLYEKCIDASLSLRVTTEYQTAAKCHLINGPEYVIMCYNLYGYGTEPGPKADLEFLGQCADNFNYLENVKFAFSLGGFKWNNGNVSAVTENEALALLSVSGAALERESSGGAMFSYTEADGSISTVYYADSITVNTWKQYLINRGCDGFALWRLGGNNLDSLRGMK